jgi:hypothetical protein
MTASISRGPAPQGLGRYGRGGVALTSCRHHGVPKLVNGPPSTEIRISTLSLRHATRDGDHHGGLCAQYAAGERTTVMTGLT